MFFINGVPDLLSKLSLYSSLVIARSAATWRSSLRWGQIPLYRCLSPSNTARYLVAARGHLNNPHRVGSDTVVQMSDLSLIKTSQNFIRFYALLVYKAPRERAQSFSKGPFFIVSKL